MGKSSSIGGAMIYKTLERYFTLGIQLVVQIVIARILSPSDFGIVAMMAVFISVANIFINNGFNMAVIQKKEITNSDFPTALTINILIGSLLYLILFFSAPTIAEFYNTRKQYKRALEYYNKALMYGMRADASTYKKIGNIYERFGDITRANFYYKESKRLNPRDKNIEDKIHKTTVSPKNK